MNIPANCTVHNVDDLTFIAHPEVLHTNTSSRHDDGCIGKTQRIDIYRGDTLLRTEVQQFWYREGRLFHVNTRPEFK